MERITLPFFQIICKVFLLVREAKKDFFGCLHKLFPAHRMKL